MASSFSTSLWSRTKGGDIKIFNIIGIFSYYLFTFRDQFDKVILQQQLRVSKQIIILLRLLPSDFHLTGNASVVVDESIMTYLFGSLPHIKEKTDRYMHSVNKIYLGELHFAR